METLSLIDRTKTLFENDINANADEINATIEASRIMIIGGAGSIGQAVTKEIFKRKPKALHVVDLSENGLVELVRDIRSSLGYIDGDFRTFAVDYGAPEFPALVTELGPYDMFVNLAAMKHVRSERDPYTLMRLTRVNILDTVASLATARSARASRYFAVSSDKAANPFSMMGASKRIMEMYLANRSEGLSVSTARFANVAFSNGSLLDGFRFRIQKRQPLAAPTDIKRYFVTQEEAGRLCLLSIVLGADRDVFFPKAPKEIHLISFAEIAKRFLESRGLMPHNCTTEEEAREYLDSNPNTDTWPLFTFESDTTGEKPFEEFFTQSEEVDWERFAEIGVLTNDLNVDDTTLTSFLAQVNELLNRGRWSKRDIVEAYSWLLPHFAHLETGRSLDEKM